MTDISGPRLDGEDIVKQVKEHVKDFIKDPIGFAKEKAKEKDEEFADTPTIYIEDLPEPVTTLLPYKGNRIAARTAAGALTMLKLLEEDSPGVMQQVMDIVAEELEGE